MNIEKRKRLEENGWKVGSTTDFLKLQPEEKVCVECGSKYVVNKKYCLCQKCNHKRMHGETIEETQLKKFREREKKKQFNTPEKKKTLSYLSKTNKYKCSDGTLVTKKEILERYRKVCDEITNEREGICEGTGSNEFPLSFSHTISRARCQELGKTELVWSKDNIEVEGMESPCSKPKAAHNIWADAPWPEKMNLLNIQRKLNFIKKHDPEQYQKIYFKLLGLGIEID